MIGLLGILAAAWAIALGQPATESAGFAPRVGNHEMHKTIAVHPDGSIAVPADWFAMSSRLDLEGQIVRFHFGLPLQTPSSRLLEDGVLPVCRTTWIKDNIRYTQVVLVTRLQEGDLMPAGQSPIDAVLMVQVAGECLASEYAEASAAFSTEVGGMKIGLHLREGLVYTGQSETSALLAAIDIPASGIEAASGEQLRFRGNMPPGTSGAMTLKIPAARPRSAAEVELLRDLTFDDELRRVKRFWRDHLDPSAAKQLHVRFGQ